MTSLPADQKPVTGSCLGDYEVVKVLGRGTYGKALLVSRKLDQRILVVKQVELEDLDEHEKAAALNEVAVLSDMDHVNIISYETCFTEGDTLHIVMEHATQGDLGTLIQKHAASTKPFTEQEIMQWYGNWFTSWTFA